MFRAQPSDMVFTLSYVGNTADQHALDFYDVAEALVGFQRSLAIAMHLVLNGEVITQAPSLRGAKILALPPEKGSWKITAVVTGLATGIYHLGTAPKDTPVGHLAASAYDYIVAQTLGFHVDYSKSLGEKYEELKRSGSKLKVPTESQLDSAIEKCEPALEKVHRPIVISRTADRGQIIRYDGIAGVPLQAAFTLDTYNYMRFTDRSEAPCLIIGRVSSYNVNTYKGRIFSMSEKRPIPFVLGEECRNSSAIQKITFSLSSNAAERDGQNGTLRCFAYVDRSRTGRVKRYIILNVDLV